MNLLNPGPVPALIFVALVIGVPSLVYVGLQIAQELRGIRGHMAKEYARRHAQRRNGGSDR
jgi:hypothetical protein